MQKFSFSMAILFSFTFLSAQVPQWSTDIAPILYENCTVCHHQGGLAPFSLIHFSEAYTQRLNIINAISTGEMPPWPPDADYVHFKGERYLTSNQVTKINAWVTAGAPSGDTTTAPSIPVYLNGASLDNMDASLKCPPFTVPQYNGDLYQCFVVPTGLSQNEFMTAIDVIPGNPSIVHHVLIYEDTSSTHDARQLDDQSPTVPGYTSFGGPGVSKANLIGGWVPGTTPNVYPAGLGVPLHKGSDLVVQIHYPYGSAGKTDSTKINIRLSTGSLRSVFIAPPLNHEFSITEPLSIPANSTKTFEELYTIPTNFPIQGISLLNVAPHAHLICKDWLVFAKTPAGDTIPLIKINNWDFHWQGFYTFQKLIFIPIGSTLFGYATYDNTANNPHNPNSPPQNIHVGEATTDEMMLVYFSYLIYQPGDENMVLDSTILNSQPTGIAEPKGANSLISTLQLYDAVPNPAKAETSVSYYLPETSNATLSIYDLNGRLVKTLSVPGNEGINTVSVNTSELANGDYLMSLLSNKGIKSKRLVVLK